MTEDGRWVMPDYMRLLTAEEAENRRAYLAAHPEVDELTLAPNVSGYAPVADWLEGRTEVIAAGPALDEQPQIPADGGSTPAWPPGS